MPEVSHPGEQADDAVLVAQVQGVLIAFGAAGLDDALDAGVDEQLRPVVEGEERVGGCGRGFGAADPLAGFFDCDVHEATRSICHHLLIITIVQIFEKTA